MLTKEVSRWYREKNGKNEKKTPRPVEKLQSFFPRTGFFSKNLGVLDFFVLIF
jgi:hypothetical protein